MTARCDFSDLPQDQCAHCLGHAEPQTAAEQPARWIEARYRGRCSECEEPYTPGALILYDPRNGGWLAECCAMNTEADW